MRSDCTRGRTYFCTLCARVRDTERKGETNERIKKWQKTEKGKATRERYADKYPEKIKARSKVSVAVLRGKLTKQPCEVCGDANAEAHHEDYTKPLTVRWLCLLHHRESHE